MIYPNEKEIEEAAEKEGFKTFHETMDDIFPVGSNFNHGYREMFASGATWAIAEVQKRSSVGFDEWWKAHWGKDVQSTSKHLNACRYAYTDATLAAELRLSGKSNFCHLCEELEKAVTPAVQEVLVKITALETRLKDAEEGFRFYTHEQFRKGFEESGIIAGHKFDISCAACGEQNPGKRAREYFIKYPDAKEPKEDV